MSIAGTLRSPFSPDLGIDLGTANTVVFENGTGVIVSEPSVVAYRTSDDTIIAIGHAAKELAGRASRKHWRVYRPPRSKRTHTGSPHCRGASPATPKGRYRDWLKVRVALRRPQSSAVCTSGIPG